jgi:hypothetical protein
MLVVEGQCVIHFVKGCDVDELTGMYAVPKVGQSGVLSWDIPAWLKMMNANVRR